LRLNNSINFNKNIINDLFSNEADLNTEHLSYIFILNLNTFNIINLSFLNILAYNFYVVSDIKVKNKNKDMRLNSFKDD